ncbi:MAG: D-2-hydroxyacid dehydrogenase [Candidatus Acidiferrales bacterium]
MKSPARPPSAKTKLLICVQNPVPMWNPPPDIAQRIHVRFPEMRVVHLPDYDRFERELPDADILIAYSLAPEQLAKAARLRWIQSVSTGVNQFLYPELCQSGVLLTNARSVHSVPMAQHIVGTMLALARQFPECFRYQQQSEWAQKRLCSAPVPPRELLGQVLLFIGFGAIGRDTANLLRPFGVRVWVVTRSGRSDPDLVEKVFPSSQLHEALAEADFVVIAAPDTPETRQMIGARELAQMKPSAYLINVARGSIVDEAALVATLQQHAIAGAALDVTATEPLPPESLLWKLDNTFITPHVSAATDRVWERHERLIVENLQRWFTGRELLNRVDLEHGY